MTDIEKYYLDNGLKVFLKEDLLSPVSSIFVWVNTGSAYENDNERGLAHVHEHMIFKGTKNLKVGEISKQLEAHGGEVNAFTSFDETVYYTTISNQFIDIGLDILSDCMCDATFDKDELAKELEVIVEEIKRGKDSPSNCLSEMVFKNTFSSTSYGLPIIGTIESVRSFNQSDVKAFYDKWYQAANMHLVVVSGIKKDIVKPKIDNFFKKIRGEKVIKGNFPVSSKEVKFKIDIEQHEVNEIYFAFSFKTQDSDHEDTPILDLISHILGSGSSSLLNKDLKEKLSLVTSIYSLNYSMRHSGLTMIGGTLKADKLDDAIKEIISKIIQIKLLDFDLSHIERAKNSIISDDLHENETVQGQAQAIGYLESLTGELKSKEKYLARIKDITPEEISKACKKYLIQDNLKFNIIFPKNSKIEEESYYSKIISDCFINQKKSIDRSFDQYSPKDYSLFKTTYHKPAILKLDCGVNLLIQQNNKTPLFSLRTISAGGVRFEAKHSNGQFSVMSELFERGSKSFTKDELFMKSELLASDIEGYSGRNTFGLKLLGPSANIPDLIEIFSDVLCRPSFLEQELEIVKRDTLSYLNRKKQNYAALAADKFYELLFSGHPYSMNQYGTEETLHNISILDIKEKYKKFMSSENLLISAVGNFDADLLVENLNKNMDLPNSLNKVIDNSSFTPIDKDKFFSVKLGDKQQSHIIVGTYAPSMESEDQYAFHVINSCLSGMGGRLFLELRDKKSLAYTVSSFFSPTPIIGHFGVYIGCSPEKRDESIDAINKELDRLILNGVSNDEIERSKNYLIGKNDISLQRNASINTRIAQGAFFGMGYNEPFEFSSKIRDVTEEEIYNVIRKYFNGAKKVIVAYEPV